jgi:hypothetical protein
MIYSCRIHRYADTVVANTAGTAANCVSQHSSGRASARQLGENPNRKCMIELGIMTKHE